jgi:hypothetical protein
MNASGKLRRWYERLCEYKKTGLVRTGLRGRGLVEIYQILKRGDTTMGGVRLTMGEDGSPTAVFWKCKKKSED